VAAVVTIPFVLAIALLALRPAKLDRTAFGAAGRQVTIVAAVVFGLLLGGFAWFRLDSFGLATYTAGTSFIATIILGFLVSLLYARVPPRRENDRHAPEFHR
jgi:hypothetical protein